MCHFTKFCILSIIALLISFSYCQQYDFAAEITRQCLVPDPVGLLDCVEARVNLPYLKSWVDCTNSLGQNVATSRDIINYRCKSVWEGKGVIPEVFYIKDCVIEKTGLPAKNVSAEVLGAYKECERSPPANNQQLQQNHAPVAPVSNALYPQVPITPSGQIFQQFIPFSRQHFTLYPPSPYQQPAYQQYSQQPISPQNYQFQQPISPQNYQFQHAAGYLPPPPPPGSYYYGFTVSHPQRRLQ